MVQNGSMQQSVADEILKAMKVEVNPTTPTLPAKRPLQPKAKAAPVSAPASAPSPDDGTGADSADEDDIDKLVARAKRAKLESSLKFILFLLIRTFSFWNTLWIWGIIPIPLVNINFVWKIHGISDHLHQVFDFTKNSSTKAFVLFQNFLTAIPRWIIYSKNPSKDENAIKAKLRRFCEKKADGTSKAPEWLHEQWKKGDKLNMALQFQSLGFDQVPWPFCCPATVHVYSIWCCSIHQKYRPLPVHVSCQEKFIRFKEKTTMKKDTTSNDLAVGWYSKEDMKKSLHWNQNFG